MPEFSGLLQEFTKTRDEKRPGIKAGNFRLLDNPIFCSAFLSFIAEKSQHFPTFAQWLRFLKTENKAPKKPDRDDPFLYKNPDYFGRDDLEARTYRAYIFTRKMEQYQEARGKVQEKEEKRRKIKARYGNDKRGYCTYVFDRLDAEEKRFIDKYLSFNIPESRRLQHTYINGGTGSGKSEMMKSLIHHYLTKNTETALVLIDPHGKIAQEVAQFKENADNDRLVFIAPDFDPSQSPVFNPFEYRKGIDSLSLDITVQELIGAFKEILQDVGFTPQMETLLKPCIAALLLYPDGNLYHLQQFMDKDENSELLAFALENLPNPAQRHFLKTDFLKTAYAPSRQSIRTKIQSLLNSQIFLHFVIGKSSFSLAEAIEQKKLIIFSLSRNSGAETSDTMGRLLLASLQSIAMQRASLTGKALEQAPPIHLFIDECQHYVTPSIETILTETRKYKLFLTLANQFLGQIENRKIKNAIKGNTALKITGRQTEPDTLASIAKITGANTEEIQHLETGQYHCKMGELESLIVRGKTALLDSNNAMKAEQWKHVKAQQIATYYRPTRSGSDIFTEENQQKNKARKRKKKRSLN